MALQGHPRSLILLPIESHAELASKADDVKYASVVCRLFGQLMVHDLNLTLFINRSVGDLKLLQYCDPVTRVHDGLGLVYRY